MTSWKLTAKETERTQSLRVFSLSESIHPSSIAYPAYRVAGGWSQSQTTSGERQGTPWTCRQSIAVPSQDNDIINLRSWENNNELNVIVR